MTHSEELARLIYDRSPSAAQDLVWAINEWDAVLRGQELSSGHRYDPGLNPDAPHLLGADKDRRERLDALRQELELLVRMTP
jgi:hypothetical protein